jgi:hypothetical protein
MTLNLEKELAELRQMTVAELRERYEDVWGEPARSRHKVHLVKRIAWKLQANAEGFTGHPEHVLQRARELADLSHLRVTPPKGFLEGNAPAVSARTIQRTLPTRDQRLPMSGTVLIREYKGQTLRVTVLESGFEYDGAVYRSLSAVAREITSSHINGYMFFRLGKKGERKA